MMGLSPGDVSIYIPARDSERTLQAAIDSVRQQTVEPHEFFLVVDTRSNDSTADIARSAGVRVIEQNNGRLGHGRNLAIEGCRTPWLASCDADVTLEPDWLEALLAVADNGIGAVGGATHECLITDADRWRQVNMPHNWGPGAFDNPFMLVSEMMARVDVLAAVGGYLPDLRYGEDSDLCQRIRHAGFTLRYQPAARAHHNRADSVESVLDLRWAYSFNRQRFRLESLPGLVSKLAINRTYCLQGLSQTLHSEHADTCAVALLLWFHHIRRDLHCVLERWPLFTEASRCACLLRLEAALVACVRGEWSPLMAAIARLLPNGFGTSAYHAAAPDVARSLCMTPGFEDYLAAVRDATIRLLEEIPSELVSTLVQSADELETIERLGEFEVPRIPPTPEQLAQLEAEPERASWDWSRLIEDLQQSLGPAVRTNGAVVSGPTIECEVPSHAGSFDQTGRPVELVLIPHVESSPNPIATLRNALGGASAAVVAYQTPSTFVPSVPVLTARDLAGVCVVSGFEIRHFHTEAGLTRLIVQRADAKQRHMFAPSESWSAV